MLFESTETMVYRAATKKGYVTSVFGKWHLNVEPKGFDHYDILFDQGEYYNPKFRRPDTNGEYIT